MLSRFYIAHKKIYKLELNKAVKLNKEVVKLDKVLNIGDALEINQTILLSDHVKPYKADIDVVYEDDDILVLNKPRKCLVYSDGTDDSSLTNRIAYHYETYYPILPVHRIDYDTTGLVVFAKHPMILSYISRLFEEDFIEKTYSCLVENPFNGQKGVINGPIAKDRHDNKMRVSPQGKKATTSYEVVGIVDHLTKLDVMIKGGRKHQIRVHLRSIGHPIVSDPLYGHINKSFPNLMLHFKKS